jgi:hypothetical protein
VIESYKDGYMYVYYFLPTPYLLLCSILSPLRNAMRSRFSFGTPLHLLTVDLKQAYDSHCNLVLGEVTETVYIIEEDEDEQDHVRTVKKQSEMLFVRGDSVVLIAPQGTS